MATVPKNTYSLQNIGMPPMNIRLLNCKERIARVLVAIGGLLISLWANGVMVVIFSEDKYRKIEKFAIQTAIYILQIPHLIIVLTSTIGLYFGIKERNRTFVQKWMLLQILELVTLCIGCSLLYVDGRQSFMEVLPVSLIFLMMGTYLLMCVWDTYGKLDITTGYSSFEEVN